MNDKEKLLQQLRELGIVAYTKNGSLNFHESHIGIPTREDFSCIKSDTLKVQLKQEDD